MIEQDQRLVQVKTKQADNVANLALSVAQEMRRRDVPSVHRSFWNMDGQRVTFEVNGRFLANLYAMRLRAFRSYGVPQIG